MADKHAGQERGHEDEARQLETEIPFRPAPCSDYRAAHLITIRITIGIARIKKLLGSGTETGCWISGTPTMPLP
jgi:hypothetical protein